MSDRAPAASAFEAHATACLLAGATHRAALLAVATKLTGCPEAGRDLFHQTLLNCHDAIQRRGFAGERYECYLRTSLRHLHGKQARAAKRTRPTDFQAPQAYELVDPLVSEEAEPTSWAAALLATEAPEPARALLAEQVAAEARARFTYAERVALRLHADGYSAREISELMGVADRYQVRHLLDRLKTQLRRTFGQAWRALLAEYST